MLERLRSLEKKIRLMKKELLLWGKGILNQEIPVHFSPLSTVYYFR